MIFTLKVQHLIQIASARIAELVLGGERGDFEAAALIARAIRQMSMLLVANRARLFVDEEAIAVQA